MITDRKRWAILIGASVAFASTLSAGDSGPGGLFSSGSSAESKADQLFVAALAPTPPYVELLGQRIPIREAWLEKRSTADSTIHRIPAPGRGLILVVRFEVPRSQEKLLLKYYDPSPEGGGLQSHGGGLIMLDNISGDLPRYFLNFQEHFRPASRSLFTLELRRQEQAAPQR